MLLGQRSLMALGHVDDLAGDVASPFPANTGPTPQRRDGVSLCEQGSPDSLLANLQAARVATDLAGELFRG